MKLENPWKLYSEAMQIIANSGESQSLNAMTARKEGSGRTLGGEVGRKLF